MRRFRFGIAKAMLVVCFVAIDMAIVRAVVLDADNDFQVASRLGSVSLPALILHGVILRIARRWGRDASFLVGFALGVSAILLTLILAIQNPPSTTITISADDFVEREDPVVSGRR